MSLINDALKKAQRDRGESSTQSGHRAQTGTAPSRGPARQSAYRQLAVVGAGVGFGLLIIVAASFILRPSPAQTPLAVESPSAPPSTPLPRADANTSSTEPSAPPLVGISTIDAPPAAPSTVALSHPGRPSLRMINTVEAFRISGVRASATDSKVVMNGRIYQVGDIVDHEQGIRITAVTANSVIFEDESGATYTRKF
jgi:hypothetical protein